MVPKMPSLCFQKLSNLSKLKKAEMLIYFIFSTFWTVAIMVDLHQSVSAAMETLHIYNWTCTCKNIYVLTYLNICNHIAGDS